MEYQYCDVGMSAISLQILQKKEFEIFPGWTRKRRKNISISAMHQQKKDILEAFGGICDGIVEQSTEVFGISHWGLLKRTLLN